MSDSMSVQARKSRAAYYREWRRKNPEKSTEYQKRYWERKTIKDSIDKASDVSENREKR